MRGVFRRLDRRLGDLDRYGSWFTLNRLAEATSLRVKIIHARIRSSQL
jgi:hypothetical protein